MSAIVVIPARLQSVRLPKKILADIAGKPLIQHVYEAVQKAELVEDIVIATDSEEVVSVVRNWGGRAFLTDPNLPSGTARIASIINHLQNEYIINVQGDMPLIQPDLLDQVISKLNEGTADIVTSVWPIKKISDIKDPGCAKVVCANDGRAIYFSRSPIPHLRDYPIEEWLEQAKFWGHYGIYGYRRHVLEDIAAGKLKTSPLEEAEKLEQLSFLEAGYSVYTIRTDYQEIPVDTQEELDAVRKLFSKKVK